MYMCNGGVQYNPLAPSGDDSTHGSKRSLNKRQLSQTQSEPETSDPPATATNPVRPMMMERSVTFTEPTIKVIPPTIAGGSNRTALLMHMHTEYTSITDELESVCGLLSPPRSPGLLSPPRPEQSPPSKLSRSSLENHCFITARGVGVEASGSKLTTISVTIALWC
jgi:hypothetical protein